MEFTFLPFQAILKGKNVKRNRSREEPREYETTDEEVYFEDKMIRKVEKKCRRKD